MQKETTECTVVDHRVNERSEARSRRLEMSRVTKSVAPPTTELPHPLCCYVRSPPDAWHTRLFSQMFLFLQFFHTHCIYHWPMCFPEVLVFFNHFPHPSYMITCQIVVVFQPKKWPAFSQIWISHIWGTLFCFLVNKLLNFFTSQSDW